MTRDTWQADRLDLLIEIARIEFDVALLEQQHGPHEDFDDVRQRVQRVRVDVLEQLRGMHDAGAVTLH